MCTALTTDEDITSYVTEAEMTLHRVFLNLCTALTTDDDITSYVTEAEMTLHRGFQNLCMACVSIPYK